MTLFRSIIALVCALLISPATAQTNQGSSPYSVSKGGTGVAAITNHCVVVGGGTSPVRFACPSSANTVLRYVSGDPTFGALVGADLPLPTASTLGGVFSKTATTSQWLRSLGTDGAFSASQPSFSDISGVAAWSQVPPISGLSVAAAAADADTLPVNQGAGNLKQTFAAIKTWIKGWIVKADVGLGNADNTSDATKWAAAATVTNKTFDCAANTCTVRLGSDVTGTLQAANFPALTGDVTTSAGSLATSIGAGKVTSAMLNADVYSTAHTWSGAQSFSGAVDLKSAVLFTGVISPSQITSSQNDYAPTGFSTANVLRLNSDAARDITGLAGGADGRTVIVHNIGTFAISLINEGVSSTAGNRFLLGGDIVLLPDTSITLRYDGTSSRWRAISTPGAGGGGGGGVSGVTIAAGDGIRVDGTCNITTSGTCTVSQSDSERVNTALDRIYQSKALGSPRRVINSWADGLKSASGINAGASSNYTLDTANGRVFPAGAIDANTIVLYHFDANATTDSSGNSNTATATGSPTVSSTNAKFSNALQLSGSGQYLTVPSTSAFNVGTGSFSFDFWMVPSSVSGTRNIFSQSVSSSANGLQITSSKLSWHIDGVGDFAGTTTLVAGTSYHVEFSRSGSSNVIFLNGVAEISFTNSSSYDLRGSYLGHGNFNSDFAGSIDEFRFSNIARHAAGFSPPSVPYGTLLDMSLEMVAQTTDGSVSSVRVLIEFDNSATPTLDTDLTVDVTCNGGTNWASAALSAVTSNSQGGRKVVETVDQACTAGTSFAAHIETANGKNVPIYGISVSVH